LKIFVTGYHRAGTHAFAEYIAEKEGLAYIEEGNIKWDNLNLALGMPDGACIHCPGLAHKTRELAKFGKVYWCDRDKEHIVTSMHNGGIELMAWHLMNNFHDEFPNEDWNQWTYTKQSVVGRDFVEYYRILLQVKDYFYNKYFKNITELIQLESQPYYDFSSTVTSERPL
jgi:hypothetical protein